MSLDDLIAIERVTLLGETPHAITARYEGCTYEFIKSDHSGFGHNTFFQDQSAPREFWEIMIFHELEESKRRARGEENPHQEAVHAEILYALRHFDSEKQQRYFSWVREYRAAKPPVKHPRTHDDLTDLFLDWRTSWRDGEDGLYERAQRMLGDTPILKTEFERLTTYIAYCHAVTQHRWATVCATSEEERNALLHSPPTCPPTCKELTPKRAAESHTYQNILFYIPAINNIPPSEGPITLSIHRHESLDGFPSNKNPPYTQSKEFCKKHLTRKNVNIEICAEPPYMLTF